MSNDMTPARLVTRHGTVVFPAYVPVTTFGAKYPLDDLVRPYLKRLAPAVMVSLYYARQMKERPDLPMFVDSGGFASLVSNARVVKRRGVGVLEVDTEGGVEKTHPRDVLEFQETHADVAFTLDFPIPPSMDAKDRKERLELTIANALWAVENRRRTDMPLYGCVQGWDVDSYRACAAAYRDAGFDGIGIGGLVPRARDRSLVLAIVDAVGEAVPDKPLHAFGVGVPETVAMLFERGVQSVDSSTYVKMAASGRLWGRPGQRIAGAAPMERLGLALQNLSLATGHRLPMSAVGLGRGPSGSSARSFPTAA